ncbi:unnamed protein product [Urochloa humidicola]
MASTPSTIVDPEAAAIDSLSKRLDQMDSLSKRLDRMMQRMEETLARMDGAPAPVAPAVGASAPSSLMSPSSPVVSEALAVAPSSTSSPAPPIALDAAAAGPAPSRAAATPSSTSSTTTTNVKRIVASFELARMRREMERRLPHLEELFTTTSVVLATPTATPSASLSSPAFSTTPPAPTSAASTSIDTSATLSSTATRELLHPLPARCSTPDRSHGECALAPVTVTPASPSTLATAPTPSLPAATATPRLTLAAVVPAAEEEFFTMMQAKCSTQCCTHLNIRLTSPTINPTATSTHLAADILGCMHRRYITTISPSTSSGVVLGLVATKRQDVQIIFEREYGQISVRIWPEFIGNLELVQTRQPWSPPISLEFIDSTFQLVYPTAICVFDRGKSKISVQNPVMHSPLVDKGLESSILNFEQVCISPKPPWSLLCVEDDSSNSHIATPLPWTHLLVLINKVQLRPMPWPSFSFYKAAQVDKAISCTWYGDLLVGLYHDAGMSLHLGIELFLLVVHVGNSSSTTCVNAPKEYPQQKNGVEFRSRVAVRSQWAVVPSIMVAKWEASLSIVRMGSGNMWRFPSCHVDLEFETEASKFNSQQFICTSQCGIADVITATRRESPMLVTWSWQRERHLLPNCLAMTRFSSVCCMKLCKVLVLRSFAAPLLECTHEYGVLSLISIPFQQQAVTPLKYLHGHCIDAAHGLEIIQGNLSAIDYWQSSLVAASDQMSGNGIVLNRHTPKDIVLRLYLFQHLIIGKKDQLLQCSNSEYELAFKFTHMASTGHLPECASPYLVPLPTNFAQAYGKQLAAPILEGFLCRVITRIKSARSLQLRNKQWCLCSFWNPSDIHASVPQVLGLCQMKKFILMEGSGYICYHFVLLASKTEVILCWAATCVKRRYMVYARSVSNRTNANWKQVHSNAELMIKKNTSLMKLLVAELIKNLDFIAELGSQGVQYIISLRASCILRGGECHDLGYYWQVNGPMSGLFS